MSLITDILPSLARSLGTQLVILGSNDQAAIELEDGQYFYFEIITVGVCVSLVYQSNGSQLLKEIRTLLHLCYYENNIQYQLSPKFIAEDVLSVSAVLPQEPVMLSELHCVVEQIHEVMTRVWAQCT